MAAVGGVALLLAACDLRDSPPAAPKPIGELVWRYYAIDERGVVLIDEGGQDLGVISSAPWPGMVLAPMASRDDRYPVGIGSRIGFVDGTGSTTISPQFDAAEPFVLGTAVVRVNDRFGIIDTSGQFILPADFAGADQPIGGRIPVRLGDRWAVMGTDQQYLVQPRYDRIRPFAEGLAAVQDAGRWGFVDAKGTVIIRPQFDEVTPFHGGRALVMLGDRCGLIDRTGRFIMSPRIGCRLEVASEGRYTMVDRGRYGFVDTAGAEVIQPQFDEATAFKEGRAAVRIDSLWGYVDQAGKYVITPRFAEAGDFSGDRAVVRTKVGYGVIDRDGKMMTTVGYDGAWPSYEGGPLLLVWRGDSLGYLNREGRPARPFMRPATGLRSWRQLAALEGRLLLDPLYRGALGGGLSAPTSPMRWPTGWTDFLSDSVTVPTTGLLPWFIAGLESRARTWPVPDDPETVSRLLARLALLPQEYNYLWQISREAAVQRELEGYGIDGSALPENTYHSGTLVIGSSVDGVLGPSQQQLWLLSTRGASQVQLDLLANQFDPYLELLESRDGQWVVVGTDDDGGDGPNARLAWTSRPAGIYAARVRSYRTSGQGGFRLILTSRDY